MISHLVVLFGVFVHRLRLQTVNLRRQVRFLHTPFLFPHGLDGRASGFGPEWPGPNPGGETMPCGLMHSGLSKTLHLGAKSYEDM